MMVVLNVCCFIVVSSPLKDYPPPPPPQKNRSGFPKVSNASTQLQLRIWMKKLEAKVLALQLLHFLVYKKIVTIAINSP